MYQIPISLYKFINGHSLNMSTELVRVSDQMVCTRRQINPNFQVITGLLFKITNVMMRGPNKNNQTSNI